MKPTVRQADHRLARRKWRTTKPSGVARRALRRGGQLPGNRSREAAAQPLRGARKTLGTRLGLSMFLQEPLGFSPREFQIRVHILPCRVYNRTILGDIPCSQRRGLAQGAGFAGQPETIGKAKMNTIPNSLLIEKDIPSRRAAWKNILPFAHTFNGYEYCGSVKKCREVARQESYSTNRIRIWSSP